MKMIPFIQTLSFIVNNNHTSTLFFVLHSLLTTNVHVILSCFRNNIFNNERKVMFYDDERKKDR